MSTNQLHELLIERLERRIPSILTDASSMTTDRSYGDTEVLGIVEAARKLTSQRKYTRARTASNGRRERHQQNSRIERPGFTTVKPTPNVFLETMHKLRERRRSIYDAAEKSRKSKAKSRKTKRKTKKSAVQAEQNSSEKVQEPGQSKVRPLTSVSISRSKSDQRLMVKSSHWTLTSPSRELAKRIVSEGVERVHSAQIVRNRIGRCTKIANGTLVFSSNKRDESLFSVPIESREYRKTLVFENVQPHPDSPKSCGQSSCREGEKPEEVGLMAMIAPGNSTSKKDNVASIHLRFKFLNSDSRLVREILERNKFSRTTGGDWTLLWTSGGVSSQTYRRMKLHQKINRFPRIEELIRKDLLFVSITKMQRLHGVKQYGIIPETFLLPQEADKFDAAFHSLANRSKLWIIKPQSSKQGRGIHVVNDIQQVPRNAHIVVSRYIDNPFLIDGRKFDLRLYVAITSFNPLRIYVHREGLVRLATEPYTSASGKLSDPFIHLTNYSIQKRSNKYVSNRSATADNTGHKWSLTAFRRYLRTRAYDDVAVFENIYDVIVKSVVAAEERINSEVNRSVQYRGNCFEILGYDIILDDNLRPWLLEVNGNPSFTPGSPLDLKVKSEVLTDTFTMLGIERNTDSKKIPTRYRASVPSYWMQGRNREDSARMTRWLLHETDAEFSRRGNFVRVFPPTTWNEYRSYFGKSRDLNMAICKHSKTSESPNFWL